ncbi:MAG: carboxypeptidase-like regulatory domain-containing protein [Planctomycetota bacterium]
MRSLVALAAVLALTLLAFLLLDRSPAPGTVVDVDARVVQEEAASTEAIVPLVEAAETAERTEVTGDEAAAAPEATSTADADEPACSVFGVVVDADQRPIAGALVQLAQYQEWDGEGTGRTLARFGQTRWTSMVGFEVRTESDGSFRLDVPEPSGERQSLYVAADRHHDNYTLRFGGTRGQQRPTLRAGEHDLGTIVLGVTGAIHGQVTDADGAPMEGVRIGIGQTKGTTLGRYATTGSDGRYVLGHAPVGTYGVDAEREGWVDQFFEPVTVEAGQDTGPIDFALERAPTLSGRVVDPDGRPIENARLTGWPDSSGSGAGSRSKADGTFSVPLPQLEPYTLEATHPDFVKWGDANDGSTLYEPGRSDIEIVMTPSEKTTFLVVDAATGEPIERFGIGILEDNGSKAKRRVYTERRRPRPKDRPGGTRRLNARVGEDLYVVHAEGYLLATGDVEHDVEGEALQTVRLRSGGRLLGRVTKGGAALPGADVDVVVSRRSRVDENTMQRTTTDADGRFVLAGLSGSQYRLTVRAPQGAPMVLSNLECLPGQDTDVGEIAIVPGGTIAGVVLVPASVDASGLTVRRGAWEDGLVATTDASGRFRFEDVSVGAHTVVQEGRPGVLEYGAAETVEVASGETIEVTLDATGLVLVPIQLTLDLGALPAKNVRVELRAVDAPEAVEFERRNETRIRLDEANEDGVAIGAGRPLGLCRVLIRIPGGGQVEHPTARIDVTAGQPVVETVSFRFAQLALEGAEDLPLPDSGTLMLEMRRPDKLVPDRMRVDVEDGELQPPQSPFMTLDDGTLLLDGLGGGPLTLSVSAFASDAPSVDEELPDGSYRSGPKMDFERIFAVTLEAGERRKVDVR